MNDVLVRYHDERGNAHESRIENAMSLDVTPERTVVEYLKLSVDGISIQNQTFHNVASIEALAPPVVH